MTKYHEMTTKQLKHELGYLEGKLARMMSLEDIDIEDQYYIDQLNGWRAEVSSELAKRGIELGG